MRAELIAVASHELRTPLTTLRMTLLMLRESDATLPPREQELVGTCFSGVQALSDTIDEFLDLTRIEAGHLRLNLEPLDARALLEGTVARWRARNAAVHDVSLLVQAGPNALLHGDAARLKVVLDNLLSNALKYAPRGSRIRLAGFTGTHPARVSSSMVRISVIDEGRGVPPEFRQRIFDKFFRVEHQKHGLNRGAAAWGLAFTYASRSWLFTADSFAAMKERGTSARESGSMHPQREPKRTGCDARRRQHPRAAYDPRLDVHAHRDHPRPGQVRIIAAAWLAPGHRHLR